MESCKMNVGANIDQGYWLECPERVWVPGWETKRNEREIQFVSEGQVYTIPIEKMKDLVPVEPTSLVCVDDLLDLGEFSMRSLLHTVRERYMKNEIYTSIGSSILVALNPYVLLEGLYSESVMKQVKLNPTKNFPHAYSIGRNSYNTMVSTENDQSIIISGESGAGKTETTKILLRYFTNADVRNKSEVSTIETSEIEEQVLQSNPILEAFGNAKTLRNDNSSRFGKFLEIIFSKGTGRIVSAKISNYLLEQSRIIRQRLHERNYHIFYQLVFGGGTGIVEKQELPAFSFLGNETLSQEDKRIFEGDWRRLEECFTCFNFTQDDKEWIVKTCLGILFLGNVRFTEVKGGQGATINPATICFAKKATDFLGLDLKQFEEAIQFKSIPDFFSKKMLFAPRNEEEATWTRDAMAKSIFQNLFQWLVNKINISMANDRNQGNQDSSTLKICILDIYGFEVFAENGFEQLCINFANEKLQQHFNKHIFMEEQKTYQEEEIDWESINFVDNQQSIDVLEKKPYGIFPQLDSECLMPQGTDSGFLSKIVTTDSDIIIEAPRLVKNSFGVRHYAGIVMYDVTGFVDKNCDKLHRDVSNLLGSSTSDLIQTLFPNKPEPLHVFFEKENSSQRRISVRGLQETVSSSFQSQLSGLMKSLKRTNPSYIRCIKSNSSKQPRVLDSVDVLRQLQCAGMLESIRIRKAGFPCRMDHKEFQIRYRHLSDNKVKESPNNPTIAVEKIKEILKIAKLPISSFAIGLSKVFLKEEGNIRLEKLLTETMAKAATELQRFCRRRRVENHFKARKYLAVTIQGLLHMSSAKKQLKELKAGSYITRNLLKLQAKIFCKSLIEQVIEIQRHCRTFLVCRWFGKEEEIEREVTDTKPRDVQQNLFAQTRDTRVSTDETEESPVSSHRPLTSRVVRNRYREDTKELIIPSTARYHEPSRINTPGFYTHRGLVGAFPSDRRSMPNKNFPHVPMQRDGWLQVQSLQAQCDKYSSKIADLKKENRSLRESLRANQSHQNSIWNDGFEQGLAENSESVIKVSRQMREIEAENEELLEEISEYTKVLTEKDHQIFKLTQKLQKQKEEIENAMIQSRKREDRRYTHRGSKNQRENLMNTSRAWAQRSCRESPPMQKTHSDFFGNAMDEICGSSEFMAEEISGASRRQLDTSRIPSEVEDYIRGDGCAYSDDLDVPDESQNEFPERNSRPVQTRPKGIPRLNLCQKG
eukprot:GHVP01056703.1.p1 GENE.GHVP01056703.1~~GHVP01056703.1.p1  ORF type:complete len:1215 (+),score=238.17 GHVP01056703.1:4324-7968(+)